MIRGFVWLALLLCAAPAWAGDDDPVPPERTIRKARLRLSDAQRRTLSRLEKSSEEQTDRLKDQIKRLRKQLDEQYRQYILNTDRVRGLHREINEAQSRLLDVHLDTQAQLRKILSADQFAALQRAIRDDDDDDDDRRRKD